MAAPTFTEKDSSSTKEGTRECISPLGTDGATVGNPLGVCLLSNIALIEVDPKGVLSALSVQ